MANSRFSSAAWWLGTLISSGGKDTAIPHVVLDDGSGNASGSTAALAPFTKQVSAAGFTGGNPTYRISGTGYGGYATPTDLLTISGSATKTIIVTGFQVGIQSTAGGLQTLYFLKRSAANTGGTATNPTAIALDSTNAAATAVVNFYTVVPTTGTSLGAISTQLLAASTLTSQPVLGGFNLGASAVPALMISDFRQGWTLRGVAESICLNYNGAALPAGFAMTYLVEWVEI